MFIKAVEGLGTRCLLVKWHISSRLFTKLDDFLPFVFYMIEWSLHNKKLRFLLIHNIWKTEIIYFFSIIVPSPSTALAATRTASTDIVCLPFDCLPSTIEQRSYNTFLFFETFKHFLFTAALKEIKVSTYYIAALIVWYCHLVVRQLSRSHQAIIRKHLR